MKRSSANEQSRKSEILLAARNLIFLEGASKLTMRRLGEAVAITEPAVYRHFRNKEELLGELVRFMFDGWEEKLTALKAEPGSASEKLIKLGKLHLNHLFEHQFNPVLLLSEASVAEQPAVAAVLNEKGERIASVMAAVIQEGCTSGEFPPDLHIRSALLAILGVLQGSLIRWTLTRSTRGLASDVDGALRLVVKGLSAHPPKR